MQKLYLPDGSVDVVEKETYNVLRVWLWVLLPV